ncbi:MAG: hypothetical protein ABFR89_07885 [Actinomycetota bacterium]
MSEKQRDRADWTVPAILVGVVAVLFLIGWAVSSLVGVGDEDAPPLVQNLDRYTRCLADHGANVPRVETRSDGGFAVVVPGSLLDEGADQDAWRVAHGECGEEARVLFEDALNTVGEHLLEGLVNGSWTDALGGWGPDSFAQPFGAGVHPPGDLLPGLVDRLRPPDPDHLEHLCEALGDGSLDIDKQTLRELERRCGELDR